MRSLRPIALVYLLLLILSVAVRAWSFEAPQIEWLAYTDFFSTVIILTIAVSILQTEKERKGIVAIAWLTFIVWLAFCVSLALPSAAEWLAAMAVFLNLLSVILGLSLFFTRKSPLRTWYRWLGLGLAATFLFRIVTTVLHLELPSFVYPLIEIGSFLLQNIALFVLVQKAPGFRRPATTE